MWSSNIDLNRRLERLRGYSRSCNSVLPHNKVDFHCGDKVNTAYSRRILTLSPHDFRVEAMFCPSTSDTVVFRSKAYHRFVESTCFNGRGTPTLLTEDLREETFRSVSQKRFVGRRPEPETTCASDKKEGFREAENNETAPPRGVA